MLNAIAVMRKMRSAISAIAPRSVAGRRPDQTLIGSDRRARAGLGAYVTRAGNVSMVSEPHRDGPAH